MLNRENSLYILVYGMKSRCENLVDGVSQCDDDHDILFHFLLIIDSLCFWQVNKTSIVVDASRYIEELKEKVDRVNQEIGTSQISTSQNPLPMVNLYKLELHI